MHNFVSILVEKEEKAGRFAIIVLQMYCYYNCSVALPHDGLVCIMWSYSLTFSYVVSHLKSNYYASYQLYQQKVL